MADDPPKKEVPAESLLPPAPNIPSGTIRIENTISPERLAQLRGSKAPQICAAATKAETEARKRLEADKTVRWLYLAARGKLELEILLQIRYWQRYGTRRKYSVPGLKGTDGELADFFGVKRPSICRARKALKQRGLIISADGVLQLRYATILEVAMRRGWSD